MAAPFLIPFNHMPTNTVTRIGSTLGGSVSDYTVPAGYYARVTISANAGGYFSGSGAATQTADNINSLKINTNDSDFSISIWINEGDVISSSGTANSATATSSTSATDQGFLLLGAAFVSVSLNSSVIFQPTVNSSANGTYRGDGASNTKTYSLTMGATWSIHIEEFPVLI